MTVISISLDAIDNASNTIAGVGGAINEMAIGALRSLGELAVDGFGKAAGAVVDFSKTIVASAMDYENYSSRVANAVKNANAFIAESNATLKESFSLEELQALSAQFMNLAGGSDEVGLGIAEVALKMGNITKAQMPAFIQTTLDLAAATGQDATSAARILAQAYDDPASALGRFNKMGIRFTGDLDDQIKALVKAGNTSEAYALMMDRVGGAVAGAAQAAADTTEGKWKLFIGRLDEAYETIGLALLPTLQKLFDDVLLPAIPVVEGITVAIAEFAGKGGEVLSRMFDMIQGGTDPLEALGTAINNVFGTEIGTQVDAIIGPLQQVGTVVSDLFSKIAAGDTGGAFAIISQSFAGLWEMVQPHLFLFWNSIKSWIAINVPLIIAELKLWGQAFIDWIAPMIPPLLAKAEEIAAALWGWIQAQVPLVVAQLATWGNAFVEWVTPIIERLRANLFLLWNSISTWIQQNGPVILKKIQTEWGPAAIAWLQVETVVLAGILGNLLGKVTAWFFESGVPILSSVWPALVGAIFGVKVNPGDPNSPNAQGLRVASAFAAGFGTGIGDAAAAIQQKIFDTIVDASLIGRIIRSIIDSINASVNGSEGNINPTTPTTSMPGGDWGPNGGTIPQGAPLGGTSNFNYTQNIYTQEAGPAKQSFDALRALGGI